MGVGAVEVRFRPRVELVGLDLAPFHNWRLVRVERELRHQLYYY